MKGTSPPHKHAEAIKAWADGHPVQFRTKWGEEWMDVTGEPAWRHDFVYRVKPDQDSEQTVEVHASYSVEYGLRIVPEWPYNMVLRFNRAGQLVGVEMKNGW